MDTLIDRALRLLSFMDETDAAKHLTDAGEKAENVFFAVKAASILMEDCA